MLTPAAPLRSPTKQLAEKLVLNKYFLFWYYRLKCCGIIWSPLGGWVERWCLGVSSQQGQILGLSVSGTGAVLTKEFMQTETNILGPETQKS